MSSFGHLDTHELRVLQIAVGASLLLHAAALFLTPGFRPPRPLPELPTLTAVLRGLPQPEEPSAAASPPQPETRPSQTPPRPAAESKPKPETVKPQVQAQPVLTAPSVQNTPSVPVSEPAQSAPAPAAEAKSSGPASGVAGEGKAASGPPVTVASAAPNTSAASQDGLDQVAVKRYIIQLGTYALKYQRAPAVAIDRIVYSDVQFTVGSDGRMREIAIANSSGYDALDQQAIAMVRKAAPITEIPASLRNREFTDHIGIRFWPPKHD